jgi:hypothetical protein
MCHPLQYYPRNKIQADYNRKDQNIVEKIEFNCQIHEGDYDSSFHR